VKITLVRAGLLALLAFVPTVPSCTSDPRNTAGSDVTPSSPVGRPHTAKLSGGAPSARELAQRALDAFAANDTNALINLLVTREEFVTILYPEYDVHYPIAGDTSTQTRDFLWENQTLSSMGAMHRGLRDLDGRRMEVVGIAFREGRRQFRSYVLHERTRVRVRFDDGRLADVNALGSFVERDGTFKLLTYRDRD